MKAVFIFVAPNADPQVDRQWGKTSKGHLLSIALNKYAQAAETAQKLVAEEEIIAIELCGGFGNRGTAMIEDAVGDSVPIGGVRFDIHPGLGNASGDSLF